MKEITLAKGRVALVDDIDFEYLSQFKWQLWDKRGNTQYAIRKIWRDGKKTTTTMHQEILKPPVGMISDHKNGYGLDNQRHNLRVCTYGNNCMNRKPQDGTSLYKGVSAHGKKWRSRIKTKGKIYNLGSFASEIEAARMYDRAATEMFGAFARCNNV
jgi:hypothetical protein